MQFKLTIGRKGFGPEELVFDDQDTAIEHAAQWFRDGYSRLILNDEYLCEVVPSDCIRLRDDLENGREFYCNRFEERASLASVRPAINSAGVSHSILMHSLATPR